MKSVLLKILFSVITSLVLLFSSTSTFAQHVGGGHMGGGGGFHGGGFHGGGGYGGAYHGGGYYGGYRGAGGMYGYHGGGPMSGGGRFGPMGAGSARSFNGTRSAMAGRSWGSGSSAGRGAWGHPSTARAAIADGHWHSFGNTHAAIADGHWHSFGHSHGVVVGHVHPVFVTPVVSHGFGCCFFGFGVGFSFGFGFGFGAGWPGWGPFWGWPYYPYPNPWWGQYPPPDYSFANPNMAVQNNDDQSQNKSSANSTIQSNIKSVLEGDPILSSANVEATVDDQNITLTGTVESYAQHQRVLQLVAPYAHYRKVVDKIKTAGSSS